MNSRKLTLRRETLAELTTAELGSVVAGAQTYICIQDPSTLVPTHDCTGYYPSLNAPCTGQ
jgi:hypothetical protein